eukprot:scaffold263_cov159-Amphora_coffeaeformis.AAC.1
MTIHRRIDSYHGPLDDVETVGSVWLLDFTSGLSLLVVVVAACRPDAHHGQQRVRRWWWPPSGIRTNRVSKFNPTRGRIFARFTEIHS